MSHNHNHNHNHSHHHSPRTLTSSDINNSFLIGIVLNVIYVVIELWYGWKENSTALLSDAVHNIGDISGLLLAFLAFKLMNVKSGKTFTYGFKKGSVLASFINSVLLVFAIGGIAWEGIGHIINPNPVNGKVVMIVATIGIVVNFGSALLFRSNKENDLNVKAAYWHLMADALVSAGVVVAGLVMSYTNWYFLDGVVALVVAIVILLSTWNLFKDSFIGMFDGVPSAIKMDDIKHHLSDVDGVLGIHHIHIWSVSTSENAITCHVKIDNINNMSLIKQKIRTELTKHNITHSTLEIESELEICRDK